MKASVGLASAFVVCVVWVGVVQAFGTLQRSSNGQVLGDQPGQRVEVQIVDRFDKNSDGILDVKERLAAREFIADQPVPRRLRDEAVPPKPPKNGVTLSVDDVQIYDNEPLYDIAVMRTIFFEFESEDWEEELGAFRYSDVEVPATMMVDDKVYKDVGISFRGASSYSMVWPGFKRSLNVSVDLLHKDQRLLGYRTLNLLNSATDPTFLRSVICYEVSRDYLPAPRANFVRVVINGESWGVYVNAEQFNSDFIRNAFDEKGGARWKATGSPRGGRGLEYLGKDVSEYKSLFEIKTKDDESSWADLIELTHVLNETPPGQLESALEPILSIEDALKFLSLEIVLLNGDGYWTRASDYNIYQHLDGRFHLIPHDCNETFRVPGPPGSRVNGTGGMRRLPGQRPNRQRRGVIDRTVQLMDTNQDGLISREEWIREARTFDRLDRNDDGFLSLNERPARFGRGRGRGPGGPRPTIDLDPLIGINDLDKPLISKLLSVPALREKYMGYVHDIATKWLDWERLGPIVKSYQALISADVEIDTRKLETFEAFKAGNEAFRSFAEQRRTFLLNQ